MRSTNDNLQNPLHVDLMDIPYDHPIWNTIKVDRVTQFFYDHQLPIKDLNTLYVISDSKDGRAYLGEQFVNRFREHVGYLIGPADVHGEYTLYMNCMTKYGDHLYPICRYRDATSAIQALDLCNKSGSHMSMRLEIRSCIISYIDNEIPLEDFITGIIAMFGYRDDPRLQDVMSEMRMWEPSRNHKDLSAHAKTMLRQLAEKHPNQCYKFFSDIYDIMNAYNFFLDDKYRKDPESADFSVAIKKIFDVMTPSLLPHS